MNVQMETTDRKRALKLISSAKGVRLTIDDEHSLEDCLFLSQQLWVGAIDGELICAWGLIPPTLLSDRAYLWMYHTPAIEAHKFIFVRRSQIAVEEMLTRYARIMGHVLVGNEPAKRWLRWLGARFVDHDEKLIRFEIARRSHG